VVLSGGGARAAYQVGVLQALCERAPEVHAPILTGVSAGAINTIALAAHPGTFAEAVAFLVDEWSGLTSDRVYRVQTRSLMTAAFRWLARWVLRRRDSVVHGLLDMSPLAAFLGERLDLGAIEGHIGSGRLRAAALSTTLYGPGETFPCGSGPSGGPSAPA